MSQCSKCGLCCQNINLVPELSAYDLGNGRCQYLTEENLCAIYPIRPDICNVEKMYDLYYSKLMTKEEYYQKNQEGCMALKRKKFL